MTKAGVLAVIWASVAVLPTAALLLLAIWADQSNSTSVHYALSAVLVGGATVAWATVTATAHGVLKER